MLHKPFSAHCGVLLATCIGVVPAFADTITLDAIDSGFVTVEGGAAKFDALLAPPAEFNYSVGWEKHYPGGGLKPTLTFDELKEMEKKNYFVFDFSSVTAPIVSASLELYLPSGGFTGSDSSESFMIAGTSASSGELGMLSDPMIPADIGAPEIMLAMDMFSVLTESLDFGVPAFGSVTVMPADEDGMIVMPLSIDGVDYLNMGLGGDIVLGGMLASILDDTMSYDPQELFSGTAPLIATGATPTPKLILTTVPLPAPLFLFCTGIIGFALLARKRREPHY